MAPNIKSWILKQTPLTRDQQYRVKAFIEAWFWIIILAMIVAGGAGGWFTHQAYNVPQYEQESYIASEWKYQQNMTHRADAVGQNRIFQVGTTLEERPIYYTKISPEAEGEYILAYEASDSLSANATIQMTMVIQETGEGGSPVYWQMEKEMATYQTQIKDNGRVRVSYQINVKELANDTETARQSLGTAAGQLHFRIRVNTRLTGTVNQQELSRAIDFESTLTPQTGTYTFSGTNRTTERFVDNRTRTVPVSPPKWQLYGGPAAIGAAALLTLLLLIGKFLGWFGLSRDEQRYLEFDSQRAQLDEWISVVDNGGSQSWLWGSDSDDITVNQLTDLQDLVNLAIDTDNRVLEVPPQDLYYVETGGERYEYRPPMDIDGTEHPIRPNKSDNQPATPNRHGQ